MSLLLMLCSGFCVRVFRRGRGSGDWWRLMLVRFGVLALKADCLELLYLGGTGGVLSDGV